MEFNHEFPDEIERAFERIYRARRTAVEGRGIDVSEYRDSLVAEEIPSVEFVDNRGYDLVGVGAARVVFSVPDSDCVVKVARYGDTPADDGYGQNRVEYNTWTDAPDEVNLLPVIESDESWSWLVMPEVEMLSDVVSDEEQMERFVDTLQNQLLDADVFVKLLDVRVENMGVWEDEVVLIDYGLSTEEY
jgi:hypothetical protein